MLSKCVCKSDRLYKLHLVQDFLWLFYFLVPHHISELLRLKWRPLQILILRKALHVIFLQHKHPVAVIRERLFRMRLLLRILQQILTHRLQPLHDRRINRRQTKRTLLWLHLLKPLSDHGLCYLFRRFHRPLSLSGGGVLMEMDYGEFEEFGIVGKSVRKVSHIHTHCSIQLLLLALRLLGLHQVYEVFP